MKITSSIKGKARVKRLHFIKEKLRLQEMIVSRFYNSPVMFPFTGVPDVGWVENRRAPYCYKCGTNVKNQKFCHGCGRRLLWPKQ